jgi:hypothetical protein
LQILSNKSLHVNIRMKTVGNGQKRTYEIGNESGLFGTFLHFSN